MDCERKGCLLCQTKLRTEKNLGQDCHKRNLVYETWCITCLEREEEQIEREHAGNKEKIKEEKSKIKKFLYVGETARSIFERAIEHHNDIAQLKTSSHMLRHLLESHEDEERS